MAESNETDHVDVSKKDDRQSKGSYVSDQILSVLFPFLALWYGPKYLLKGDYPKGIVILAIFAIELYFILSLSS
ncbi:MAG: hypothetical protein ACE5JF_06785 [Anaerolineales bacterium]